MDIKSTTATQGYLQSRSAAQPSASEQTGLEDIANGFEASLHSGEDTAKATMLGQADPHALVQALAQTQLAVETAVAVRDKVVEAYQEILRMPV